MLAKIELSLAPSKAKGLSEDERLELGKRGIGLTSCAAVQTPTRAPSTSTI